MLEHAISRLQATIIPPHQFDSIPCDKHSLVVIHTLTHAAMILLYSRFSQDDPASYDKCLSSTRSIVALIKHHGLDADLAFLDPIVSVSWLDVYLLSSFAHCCTSVAGRWLRRLFCASSRRRMPLGPSSTAPRSATKSRPLCMP